LTFTKEIPLHSCNTLHFAININAVYLRVLHVIVYVEALI